MDVQIGATHFRCYHKSLFEHLLMFQRGGFRIVVYIHNQQKTIEGAKQIGAVIFQEDGKTPIDTSREPGADG
jgi:hypothetical protein